MKLNKRHNKHRKFLKRYKKFYTEQGKIQAASEFNVRVKQISSEYDAMLMQIQKTHEQEIKLLTRKEKELESICNDMKSKHDKITDSLNNIRQYEAEGLQHSKNLYAMLQDEKVKKYMSLNHDTDMIKHIASKAEKEAANIL